MTGEVDWVQSQVSGDRRANAGASAVAAVERALRITALVWSALWVSLDIAPGLLDRERFTNTAPAALALAGTALAWLLLALRRRHAPMILEVMLIGLGVVLALSCRSGDLEAAVPTAMSAMYLAGIMTGLLSSPRVALSFAMSSGAVIGALLVVHAIDLGVWAASRETILSGPVFTVCDALGVIAIRAALISSAAVADVSAGAAARAREASATQRAAATERSRLARVLHDGVINTFAAIASGASALHREAIRTRCADDATVLAQLRARSELHRVPAGMPIPVGLVVEHESAGTDEPLSPLEQVPAAVRAALLGACGEALTNVAKHAGVNDARVSVSGDEDGVRILVRDRGVGFDPSAVVGGRGLSDSIIARCEEVGATVRLDSAPGEGTVVEIAWQRRGDAPPSWLETRVDRSGDLLLDAVLPLVRGVSYALLAGVSLVTAITVHSPAGLRSVAAALLLAGLMFGAQRAYRRSSELPVGWAVAMLAAIPLVLWLPGSWLSGGARVGPAWWGSVGALIPMVHLVFLSRRPWMTWGWFAVYAGSSAAFLLVGWPHATSGDVSQAASVCLLDGIIGAVLLLLRRGVRRNTERADRAFAAEADLRAHAVAVAGRDAVRARHRGAALDSAVALLTRLADGAADPAEERVRRECAREESYLRELITLPVGLERLGPRLDELLLEAHRRGVELSVRAAESTDAPDDETAARVLAVVSSAVRSSQPGESVVLGLFDTGDQCHATVVASISSTPGIQDALAETTRGGDRAVRAGVECVGDQVIVEMGWPAT